MRTVDTLVTDLIDVVIRNVPTVSVQHKTNHIDFLVNGVVVATIWPFREHATLTFTDGVLTPNIAATLDSKRMVVLRPRQEFDAGQIVAAFAVASHHAL